MRPLARVVEGHDGETPTAAIEGEIDASNTDDIAARLRSLVTNHSKSLVVALVATTYIDSAGINALFQLGAELDERQQELHLVIASSSPIARMVAIVGLDVAVPTHSSREAALAQLN